MSIVYTEQWVLSELQRLQDNLSDKQIVQMTNYTGTTTDTKEKYTELIARWLLNNPGSLQTVIPITREKSYKSSDHTGAKANSSSNRKEEIAAQKMFLQRFLPPLGRILDYQTPLKDVQKDRFKAVDLLAYDGASVRLVELKGPANDETMLRCVLEAYAYQKTVNAEKLLKDFDLPPYTPVKACVLVARDKAQHSELKDNPPWLSALMRTLSIEAFIYETCFLVSPASQILTHEQHAK